MFPRIGDQPNSKCLETCSSTLPLPAGPPTLVLVCSHVLEPLAHPRLPPRRASAQRRSWPSGVSDSDTMSVGRTVSAPACFKIRFVLWL